MPTSALQAAKRDLVKVARKLAKKYGVAIAFDRDCDSNLLVKAYKDVALEAHPDKGGDLHDMTQLTGTRGVWELARTAAWEGKGGRPACQAPHLGPRAGTPAPSLTNATHGRMLSPR